MRLFFLLLLPALFLAPSCRRDHEDKHKSSTKHKPATVTKDKHDPSKEIEALTGVRTRLVWTECSKAGDSDTYAIGNDLVLKGIDTRDGLGERAILAKPGNYSRPLLTCDGTGILFTDKKTGRKGGKKHYKPVIYLTSWKGGKPIRLADGYAVDCWRDPKSGKEWVFAVQDIRPTKGVSLEAQRLVRFPLKEPEHMETVYDDTPISPDNVQFSRDGTQASGLFPWPHAGLLSLENGKWRAQKLSNGCWTSHSPDDSGVLWVFDGNHKQVQMFGGNGAERWQIGFSDAPGVKGRELYHPRWTNHPRFFVATGPYTKQKGQDGSVINKGGATAQVLLARLSPKADKVEAWLQISHDKSGESYPDAWIEGADQASLEGHSLTHQQPLASAEAWPAQREGLLFLWRDRVALNSFTQRGGHKREGRIESRGAGRFGRFHEMQLDGGSFVVESEAAEDVLAHLRDKPAAAFEAMVLPAQAAAGEQAMKPQALFAAPGFFVALEKGKLTMTRGSGDVWESAEPLPSTPCHLVVNRKADSPQAFEAFVNGKPLTLAAHGGAPAAPVAEAITFGGGWSGGLLNVGLYDRNLSADEINRNSQAIQQRIAALPPAPPRVKLQAKLVEVSAMPTAEAIDPYASALVVYIYEVQKVLEGEYKDPRVMVEHWAMLDLQRAQGFPREAGQTFELTLERVADHPQLKGERVMDDPAVLDLEPWFDVSPPRVTQSAQ